MIHDVSSYLALRLVVGVIMEMENGIHSVNLKYYMQGCDVWVLLN